MQEFRGHETSRSHYWSVDFSLCTGTSPKKCWVHAMEQPSLLQNPEPVVFPFDLSSNDEDILHPRKTHDCPRLRRWHPTVGKVFHVQLCHQRGEREPNMANLVSLTAHTVRVMIFFFFFFVTLLFSWYKKQEIENRAHWLKCEVSGLVCCPPESLCCWFHHSTDRLYMKLIRKMNSILKTFCFTI